MKLSVALCTYNGEHYVRELLESILNQTIKVDEIVVCDDGSSDHTLEIVESIGNTLVPSFHIYRNEDRKGFKNNFFQAIDLCQGELVFLADQDDVWHPNKVETMVRWFESHPEEKVLFTNASLIDETGTAIAGDLWQRFGFDKKKQRFFNHGFGLDIWMWSNRATGATMAVRKDFVKTDTWKDFLDGYHDSIIALQGILSHSIGCLSEQLMDYRLHGDQACGAEDLPYQLQYSPLKPCSKELLSSGFQGDDLHGLPVNEQRHVAFVLERSTFKYRRFGWGSITHIRSYVRFYRLWAYKFFFYDWFLSMRHSVKHLFG